MALFWSASKKKHYRQPTRKINTVTSRVGIKRRRQHPADSYRTWQIKKGATGAIYLAPFPYITRDSSVSLAFPKYYALQYPHWFDINLANILWKHWQFIRAHGRDPLININEIEPPLCVYWMCSHTILNKLLIYVIVVVKNRINYKLYKNIIANRKLKPPAPSLIYVNNIQIIKTVNLYLLLKWNPSWLTEIKLIKAYKVFVLPEIQYGFKCFLFPRPIKKYLWGYFISLNSDKSPRKLYKPHS